LAAGKDFIYCQKCNEQVPLIDFIGSARPGAV
jgi:hypothetical protein